MKKRVEGLLQQALEKALQRGELKTTSLPPLILEVPKDSSFGDLACPVALGLSRGERRAPRAIAETILAHIEDPDGYLSRIEIAGPGYINLTFSPKFWAQCLAQIEAPSFGPPAFGNGLRVLVEFVSANPTGPLTVGHGRNAVLGDAVARLLEATGHRVTREYYFNNAGRQMKLLGESVKARYLEQLGDAVEFPEEGYQGQYIREIAAQVHRDQGDALREEPATGAFKAAAEKAIFADIESTLRRLAIRFDSYFNEDTLYRDGRIDAVLKKLRERDLAFDRDGAVWLRSEVLGLDKDRVLVKSSGEPAYRLPDIAYHEEKYGRSFDRIVDVLGADHIAEHEDVRVTLHALGYDVGRLAAIIYQFVTLTRGGAQVKMSTRKAEYVTVDELIDEKVKVREAKKYGVNPTSTDIDRAYANMGARMGMSSEQLTKSLGSQGIRPDTIKSRLKADLVWGSLVRGRFKESLLVSDRDVNEALKNSGDDQSKMEGFEYQMRPVVLIVPRGATASMVEARRNEANALRERVQSCAEIIRTVKVMRNATIRETVTKTSTDLPPPLRDLLDKTAVGHLTPPEMTRQGVEMVAVCGKKVTSVDTPKKKEIREKMFADKYEKRSKSYLESIRKSAMIEYRESRP